MLLPSRIRLLAAGYPELLAVLAAAVFGLSVQPPLAWAAGHQGISILLAVLVFATAVTIEPAALGRLTRAWPSLLAALAAGLTVLPALSWAAAQIHRHGLGQGQRWERVWERVPLTPAPGRSRQLARALP